jgi:adenylate cyclase
MFTIDLRYIAPDRLCSLATGIPLPTTTTGSALYADIAGFTALTETLVRELGPRQGVEILTVHVNRVYNALITQVEQYGGVVVTFSGDAITCWFDGDQSAQLATAAAFALVSAMHDVDSITFANERATLGIKVAIASGVTKRYAVGHQAIQRLDTLAGATVFRMAAAEKVAMQGEVIADRRTVDLLGSAIGVREWREADGEPFAVLEPRNLVAAFTPIMPIDPATLTDDQLRGWLLPAVAQHLEAGLGEFPTELRPVVALFVRFTGIDYDGDPDAETKLDRLIQEVQLIAVNYGGNLVALTIGEKGSYFHLVFGAPVAHEDDSIAALNTALDIRAMASALGYLDPIQIGIGQGITRTGAYGSETRRTYGVFGDDVNLAARLMTHALPGTILVSEAVGHASSHRFLFELIDSIRVKGKVEPVSVQQLMGRTDSAFEDRFYTSPMTGREAELLALNQYLQPIFEGRHAGLIVIHGQAGVGKSRLVYEIRKLLERSRKVLWLTGQANERLRAPLYAISSALSAYFDQSREGTPQENATQYDRAFMRLLEQADDPTLREALQQGRSTLARLVGLDDPELASEATDEKTRLDYAIVVVKTLVRAIAQHQPTILYLEDVHWLDGTSLRVVQELTYAFSDTALAIVLTSREADNDQRFEIEAVYDVPVHNIVLGGLSDDDARTIAQAVLDGPITDALAGYIHAKAEGNPFFTEQLLLDLSERKVLVRTADGYSLRNESALEVPSSVNAVLVARLDRLVAGVKAVVQRGAILGREVDAAVLSRMLRDEELPSIERAADVGIWISVAHLRYLFRHALLRDAAYDMQLESRRRELHRVAGEVIEALYPDDSMQDDALLEHWHVAGDLDRELRYVNRIAHRLIDIEGQYAAAQHLLERSLGRIGESDARRITLLNWISKAAWRRAMNAEATMAAKAARSLAERFGDVSGLATSLHNLGVVAERQGMYKDAQASFEQSRALYEQLGDQAGVAANLNSLGIVATAQGSHEAAREYLETSLAIRSDLGDRPGMSACLTNLGVAAWNHGNYDQARAYIEQSLAIDRELHDRAGIATSLANLAAMVQGQGVDNSARAYNEEGLLLFRDLGDRDGIAFCLENLGNLAVLGGAYDQAKTYFEQSLEVSRELADPVRTAASLEHLGEIFYRQQRYSEAETIHRQALVLRQEIGSTDVHISLNWLARTVLHRGDFEGARELLRQNLQIVDVLDTGPKLAALLTGAELFLTKGFVSAASAIAHYIQSHPMSTTEQRRDVEHILKHGQKHLQEDVRESPLVFNEPLEIDTAIEALRDYLV